MAAKFRLQSCTLKISIGHYKHGLCLTKSWTAMLLRLTTIFIRKAVFIMNTSLQNIREVATYRDLPHGYSKRFHRWRCQSWGGGGKSRSFRVKNDGTSKVVVDFKLPKTLERIARDAANSAPPPFSPATFSSHLLKHHHAARRNSNITHRRNRIFYPIHNHCDGPRNPIVGFQSYHSFSRPNAKTQTLSARCPAMTDLGTRTNKRMA